ncbi:MAG: N-acetyltransferase [Myxococcaceae bacterium]
MVQPIRNPGPEAPRPAAPASDVQVRRVESKADLEAFILFPFAIHKGDPNWVPPLIMDRKKFFDRKKNPWFEFGTAELFLARRDGQVVGTIAAVEDPRYNEFHGTNLGFFGFFDCINDAGVAAALFNTAATWVKARGHQEMLGPVNFSTNYECSVLVDGFDSSPYLMMTYNPRYYPALYDACGFAKAKDLFAWHLDASSPLPEKVSRVAEMVRKRQGLTVRPVNLKDYDAEVKRIKTIYNAAWEKNWGFVPVTEREFDAIAHEMKLLVKPELLLIAEVKGEPAAFAMTLPDANAAFKAAHGRLTTFGLPIGLVKMLLAVRKIKRARLITLGIREQFRKRGIDAVLYHDTLVNARKLGFTGGEISWTLEDNHLINNAIELMGGKKYKTYRLYQRGA